MRYLDTSVVVAAVTNERSTKAAQRALNTAEDLAISDWTITEVASALSIKQRTATLSAADRVTAAATFEVLVATALVVLPVARADFSAAVTLLADPATGLRAGDALHLAVARSVGSTIYTLDKPFAAAARKLGAAVTLVR